MEPDKWGVLDEHDSLGVKSGMLGTEREICKSVQHIFAVCLCMCAHNSFFSLKSHRLGLAQRPCSPLSFYLWLLGW